MILFVIILALLFGIYTPLVFDKPIFISDNQAFLRNYLNENTIGGLFSTTNMLEFILFIAGIVVLLILATTSKNKKITLVSSLLTIPYIAYFVVDLIRQITLILSALSVDLNRNIVGDDPITCGLSVEYITLMVIILFCLLFTLIVGLIRFIKQAKSKKQN